MVPFGAVWQARWVSVGRVLVRLCTIRFGRRGTALCGKERSVCARLRMVWSGRCVMVRCVSALSVLSGIGLAGAAWCGAERQV